MEVGGEREESEEARARALIAVCCFKLLLSLRAARLRAAAIVAALGGSNVMLVALRLIVLADLIHSEGMVALIRFRVYVI